MANQINGMSIYSNNYQEPRYNVDSLPVYIAREEINSFPEHRTCSHWNSGLETIYIQEGTLLITVNGTQAQLHKNDICIIDAGCVHYFESFENQNCLYYCGILDESLFCTLDSVVNQYIRPVFHSFHPNIDIVPQGSVYHKQMKQIFRRIYTLVQEKPNSYELFLIAAFHKYLGILCEALKDTFFLTTKLDTKTNISMRQMLSYIHENYAKPIRIEDLCSIGIVSRNQCFHLFNKYTGDSPANFITKYRLLISKKLLASSGLSLSEIATACGFTHQSHFTNHFSKQYQLTPLQYRKQVYQNHPVS